MALLLNHCLDKPDNPPDFVYVDVPLQASSLTYRSFQVLRSKRFQPELSSYDIFLSLPCAQPAFDGVTGKRRVPGAFLL
jgi:hypothetical protein